PVAPGIPGMEDCRYPPRLICPNRPTADYDPGPHPNLGLCNLLVDGGVTDAAQCETYVDQHTCPELLDAQVRAARRYGGNCYGLQVENCCDTPIRIDISWSPIAGEQPGPTSIVTFANGEGKQTHRVGAERATYDLKPRGNFTIFWGTV